LKAARAPAGPTFVRLVCFKTVKGLRSRIGLFQAHEEAQESDHAPTWALQQLDATYEWFATNLKVPTGYEEKTWQEGYQRAFSWFKDTATEHIAAMFDLKAAFEACGVQVELLTTRDPGRIVYEDDHQVTALPLHRRF
jgi:hypothetical protein